VGEFRHVDHATLVQLENCAPQIAPPTEQSGVRRSSRVPGASTRIPKPTRIREPGEKDSDAVNIVVSDYAASIMTFLLP
jgi:ribosome-binding protein aMBF1 (putative translation factor)